MTIKNNLFYFTIMFWIYKILNIGSIKNYVIFSGFCYFYIIYSFLLTILLIRFLIYLIYFYKYKEKWIYMKNGYTW